MKITISKLKQMIKEVRKDYDDWERKLATRDKKEREYDWEAEREEEVMPKTPEEQAALDAEIARSEEEYKERKGLDRTIRRGYRHETAFELKELIQEELGREFGNPNTESYSLKVVQDILAKNGMPREYVKDLSIKIIKGLMNADLIDKSRSY